MKQVTRYECEVCSTEYKTEELAKKCEDAHANATNFTALYRAGNKLPYAVKVQYITDKGKKNSITFTRSYY